MGPGNERWQNSELDHLFACIQNKGESVCVNVCTVHFPKQTFNQPLRVSALSALIQFFPLQDSRTAHSFLKTVSKFQMY